MPLLKLQLTETVSDDKIREMHSSLSQIMADVFSKPVAYVMIVIEKADISMAGKAGNAAFADVRSIGGINSKNTSLFSDRFSTYLNNELSIPKERIFINFADIPASLWGWNGATFG